ncbi:serine protease inhibitor 2.1-like [Cololabis saira]|uniref:serine protease inhibitor 2.1-like n=1 Tax=Cololabis saira TaxID=129043 RepID=UPI002AD4092A|nr:serine protease inhibitor 2.1-like [Cololabis saira]
MMRAAQVFWILSAVVYVGTGHPHKRQAEQDTAVDGSDNSVSLVTSANKEFAFRFYRKLAAQSDYQGKNIFYSPSSVSVALAALSVGARGETHRQLFRGLGFSSPQVTQAHVDQAFRMILANKTSREDIKEGTAVFVQNLFKPHPEFLDVLKESYLADGFTVDFTQSADSANTINKYVADKTNGKIDKLVESLDPSTIMYLLSYIYYKGTWATPFNPKLTRDDMFNVEETNQVPVKMMNMEDDFDTYYDQAINTSVLHLPFNSSYSMLLMLPDDMATLEDAISPAHVTKWLKWMKSRRHDIYVPKFSIKTSYKLNNVLTEMGMTDMFGPQADLSGIKEGQRLAVSEVVHQATLDVDESGATAAAATGIGITLLSFRHIPVLKFDRPFMVIITERNTENMLFMGKIVNPNI